MSEGWIKLHRKLTDCILWVDKEPFDRRSAWVDLLLLANHRDKTLLFNGKPMTIKQGQILTSVRSLASRWHWSNDRTLRYLRLLESLEMLHKDSDKSRTLLTIVNYGVYQASSNTDEYSDEYTDKYSDESQTRKKECKEHKNNISTNVDTQNVVAKFNEICVSFPKVVKVSDKRAKAINAILKEFTTDELINAFTKAEASDFMKNGSWASFDWLMNKNNLIKVIEGNYDNKKGANNNGGNNNTGDAKEHHEYGISFN